MKQNRMLPLALALALCVLCLTGCGAQQSASSQVDSSLWQDGYAEVLRITAERAPEAQTYYTLYDLDTDGVPELLLYRATCEADAEFFFYRFDEAGAAQCVGSLGAGHTVLCGYAAEGTVLLHYGQMGYELASLVRFSGDSVDDELTALDGRELEPEEEYLPFEALPTWPLDDAGGLDWTANPADSNDTVLNGFFSDVGNG